MRSTRPFLVLWAGQVVSLLGSGLTTFAIAIWVLDRTHQVSQFTFTVVCAGLPGALLSPFAGAIVDRVDRRRLLMVANAGAGLCSLALFLAMRAGALSLPFVYAAVAAAALCSTFQWPALTASVTLLVDQDQYGRASGMLEMGNAAASLAAPALAGLLLLVMDLQDLFLFDVLSFLAVIVALFAIRIPAPPAAAGTAPGGASLWRESADGWRFIRDRDGLRGLLLLFGGVNLALSLCGVALLPMVRAFSSPAVVGLLMSASGVGLLLGGLLMAASGGPRPRVLGILPVPALMSVCFLIIAARPAVAPMAIGVVLLFLLIPVINGSVQAIWQAKVPPGIQGRVFSVRRLVSQATSLAGSFAAGPLVDRVFQPLMAADASTGRCFGRFIGTGPGRGVALMLVAAAVFPLLLTYWSARNPRIRRIEEELPDALPAGFPGLEASA
jgi:DHA3 family macrolide efflux protein-like MFS transporter